MKANELRIGNLLYYGDPKSTLKPPYFKIEGGHSIQAVESGIDIRPILITEEILLKCGYIVLNESSAGIRYGHVVNGVFDAGLSFVYWKESKELICVKKHIKHLHQLQNLYFSLTNEELDIKDL